MPRSSKEFQNFTHLMTGLLSVPRATIEQRMAEHREQVDKNPRRRGPKRKSERTPAGPDPVAG